MTDVARATVGKSFRLPDSLGTAAFATPFLALFFLSFWLPTTYPAVKLALLTVCLAFTALSITAKGRLLVCTDLVMWLLFYVCCGMAFMLLGMTNGGPGAFRVGTVYVLWPIVFTLMLHNVGTFRELSYLMRFAVYAFIALCLYDFLFVMTFAGAISIPFILDLDQGTGFYFHNGAPEFGLSNISTLIFAMPFALAGLATWHGQQEPFSSRTPLIILFILGSILIPLSGRRGLMLIFAVAPLTTLALMLATGSKLTGRALKLFFALGVIFGLLLFGLLQAVSDISFIAMAERMWKGINAFLNDPSSIRRVQLDALISGIAERPFFGTGLGTAASYIRDPATPWSYELSYVALVFHTGLVGFSLYASGVIWTFWTGIRIARIAPDLQPLIIPILTGEASFLIASSSNPYLEKFDYIWVIFFPLIAINLYRRKTIRQPNAADSWQRAKERGKDGRGSPGTKNRDRRHDIRADHPLLVDR